MVLLALWIQDDNGGSPFHTESAHQGLVLVEINLEGDKTLLNGKADVRIGVRNSLQLLTPNSEVIVVIHQDQFLLFLCLGLGRRE